MIKDKIEKILDNKLFKVILVIAINAAFFIICNKLFTPKYEQVDDFIIMNLISKMDGSYNIYGIQMHPLICGIIILLYQTGININWYTMFILSMQFIAFTIIGTIFIDKNKSIGVLLYIAFMFIMYSKLLVYIQYTTVSILCITSGFILFMSAMEEIENIKKCRLILSICMILIGCSIRFFCIFIAMPFIILYFICNFLQNKNIKIIKIYLILILGIILVALSFYLIYNLNPTYKEFLEFHNVRTYFHDYNWLNYENNESIFNSVDWSENDRDIFYAYCFGDEKVFNTEILEKLRQEVFINGDNIDILNKSIETFKCFFNEVSADMYRYIFIVVILLVIFNNIAIIINNSKEDKKNNNIKIVFINLTLIGIIIIHCLFIFLNRPMFRVILSIYILGIVILMYTLLDLIKLNNKKIIQYTFIVFIMITSILELKQNIYFAKLYKKEDYSVYKEILEYTSSHKENAYLYTLVMHDRYLAYSIYEKIGDNTFLNVRPLGDWDMYTANYYSFKKRYNIENLIESLYKNDNVYLISGDVIWEENYQEYINIVKKYIKEHYNIEVQYNVIKEFSNNIKIYKLIEK